MSLRRHLAQPLTILVITFSLTAAKAPDFTVTDSAGVEHALAAYRGRTVVIEWMNPYCEANAKHYNSRNLPGIQRKWNDDGLVWLMINSYAPEVRGYVSANVARYLLTSTTAKVDGFVSDTTGDLARKFGVDAIPFVVIIGSDGEIAYRGGFDDHHGDGLAGIAAATSYIDGTLTALAAGKAPLRTTAPSNGCAFP